MPHLTLPRITDPESGTTHPCLTRSSSPLGVMPSTAATRPTGLDHRLLMAASGSRLPMPRPSLRSSKRRGSPTPEYPSPGRRRSRWPRSEPGYAPWPGHSECRRVTGGGHKTPLRWHVRLEEVPSTGTTHPSNGPDPVVATMTAGDRPPAYSGEPSTSLVTAIVVGCTALGSRRA